MCLSYKRGLHVSKRPPVVDAIPKCEYFRTVSIGWLPYLNSKVYYNLPFL